MISWYIFIEMIKSHILCFQDVQFNYKVNYVCRWIIVQPGIGWQCMIEIYIWPGDICFWDFLEMTLKSFKEWVGLRKIYHKQRLVGTVSPFFYMLSQNFLLFSTSEPLIILFPLLESLCNFNPSTPACQFHTVTLNQFTWEVFMMTTQNHAFPSPYLITSLNSFSLMYYLWIHHILFDWPYRWKLGWYLVILISQRNPFTVFVLKKVFTGIYFPHLA